MAKLIFKTGIYAGKSLTLVKDKVYVLGRNRDVELPLPDPRLSRRHCQVVYSGGQVLLKDFNSTNGTFVNEVKIESEVELHPQDQVALGSVEMEVDFEGQNPPENTVVGDETVVVRRKSAPIPVPSPKWGHAPASQAHKAPSLPQPVPLVEIASSSSELIIPTEVARPQAALADDSFEAALHDLSLPLPPDPPPLAPQQMAKDKLLFCDRCNSSIPQLDADIGQADEVQGKLYCRLCLAIVPKPKATVAPSQPARATPVAAVPAVRAQLAPETRGSLEELPPAPPTKRPAPAGPVSKALEDDEDLEELT